STPPATASPSNRSRSCTRKSPAPDRAIACQPADRSHQSQDRIMQTEFTFRLPLGYVDAEGTVHRDGTMRLATAFDEIAPLKDPRVQSNPGYLLVILLSRVVLKVATLERTH